MTILSHDITIMPLNHHYRSESIRITITKTHYVVTYAKNIYEILKRKKKKKIREDEGVSDY